MDGGMFTSLGFFPIFSAIVATSSRDVKVSGPTTSTVVPVRLIRSVDGSNQDVCIIEAV